MLISQVKAAEIAGVTRQNINKIKKEGTYNFFSGTKVDTDSNDWKSYLYERGIKFLTRDENEEVPDSSDKKTKKSGKKNKIPDKIDHEPESDKQKHALTGGYDPGMFTPTTPSQLKSLTDVMKSSLEMQIKLGLYIDREMVQSAIDQIGNVIQSHLVDLPRKQSSRIAKKLKRVGMEKEVEKILSEPIAKAIREVKTTIEKALNKKYKNESTEN